VDSCNSADDHGGVEEEEGRVYLDDDDNTGCLFDILLFLFLFGDARKALHGQRMSLKTPIE
jgi:hypothetical protein